MTERELASDESKKLIKVREDDVYAVKRTDALIEF
jgi:hypothetical protein